MPLSEHDQRIIDELERGLTHDDPRLVARLSSCRLPRHTRVVSSILGVVLGLGLVVVFCLSTLVVVGVAGVAVMAWSLDRLWTSLPDAARARLAGGRADPDPQ